MVRDIRILFSRVVNAGTAGQEEAQGKVTIATICLYIGKLKTLPNKRVKATDEKDHLGTGSQP